MNRDFYKGKKVFITGHTGFKGSWLSLALQKLGAEVVGYSLEPPTEPSMFRILRMEDDMSSYRGDIRDFERLLACFAAEKPEVVFHLAAQPIVRESYRNPRDTYETNLMGTVNVLECVRRTGTVRSLLVVTTDKVYRNNEWIWGYREDETLDGYDPYSNSKSCAELAAASYKRSFFDGGRIRVSTARAGNVIGGGDFAPDRIIPDCFRAAEKGTPILVRNPDSVRPYQHVLEPLDAYLTIAQAQYQDAALAGCYNVGPELSGCVSTGRLVELFCRFWGEGASWKTQREPGPHEASFLRLDSSKIKSCLGWRPVWSIQEAMEQTAAWYRAYVNGEDLRGLTKKQIDLFAAQRDAEAEGDTSKCQPLL